MNPTNNYATTQAATSSAAPAVKLPAGGHICSIMDAREGKSYNNIPTLDLYFDIKEGNEFDGYYMNRFNAQKQFNADAKYQGVLRQNTVDESGNTNKFFKGMITAIEESNPGYKWDWNEKGLKGKKVGIVFRDKEWEYNGQKGFTAVPFYACNAANAAAMPVPKPKMLANNQAVNGVVEAVFDAAEESSDLPF